MSQGEKRCGTCALWTNTWVGLRGVCGICNADPPAPYRRASRPTTEEHYGADCFCHVPRGDGRDEHHDD